MPIFKTRCTFDPSIYIGVPLGMFHCPDCGMMVVAGLSHHAVYKGLKWFLHKLAHLTFMNRGFIDACYIDPTHICFWCTCGEWEHMHEPNIK